jgi:menaquinone-dependent protoporphyrinogen oxidase
MKLLVGYATAHGSTRGIASEISNRLMRAGIASDVRAIPEIGSLETYDVVVLGSAVHNQDWLPEAAAFMKAHASEVAHRPAWLFSVCSVGETSSFLGSRTSRFIRRKRKDTKELAGFRQSIHPRDHRYFAGAIARSHWNVLGNIFLRAFGGMYGDHRDWDDIDAWADRIARQLEPADRP